MPHDKVTIDPEFRPAELPQRDHDRGSQWLAVAAIALVVSGLGWLLGSPHGATSARNENVAEIAAMLEAFPPPRSLSGEAAASSSAVPLEDAVPGFADTITVVTRSDRGGDVLRWLASESAPATLLTVEDDGGSRSGRVDASGRWFMELRESASLVVYAVTDGNPRSSEPRLVSGAVAGVEAWSAAWHDTQAGRLAWLACSDDASGSPLAMYTVELVGSRSAPAARSVPLPDLPCGEQRVQLVRWGDWGWLLSSTDGSGGALTILLDDGGRVVEREPVVDARFVGVGPGQTTVWSRAGGEQRAEALLVSASAAPAPVPGLARDERLGSALVSPDDRLIALVVDLGGNSGSMVRIVEIATGEVVAEVAESGAWADHMVWSTDSRFLVYERRTALPASRTGAPPPAELVFYDTSADTIAAFPLQGPALSLSSAG